MFSDAEEYFSRLPDSFRGKLALIQHVGVLVMQKLYDLDPSRSTHPE